VGHQLGQGHNQSSLLWGVRYPEGATYVDLGGSPSEGHFGNRGHRDTRNGRVTRGETYGDDATSDARTAKTGATLLIILAPAKLP
jgi:hypothetical protein